jgi:hypothetical protein
MQNSTWTIILKVSDIDLTVDGGFYHFYDSANDWINLNQTPAANTLQIDIKQGGNAKIAAANTTDNLSASGDHYICAWCDGTNVRGGFATSKPDAYTDFDANKRETAVATCTYTVDFDVYKQFGRKSNDTEAKCKLYYAVISTEVLIP